MTRNRYTGRKGERKIPALLLLTKAKPLHSEGQNESEGESEGETGEREVSEKVIEGGLWQREASDLRNRRESERGFRLEKHERGLKCTDRDSALLDFTSNTGRCREYHVCLTRLECLQKFVNLFFLSERRPT